MRRRRSPLVAKLCFAMPARKLCLPSQGGCQASRLTADDATPWPFAGLAKQSFGAGVAKLELRDQEPEGGRWSRSAAGPLLLPLPLPLSLLLPRPSSLVSRSSFLVAKLCFAMLSRKLCLP